MCPNASDPKSCSYPSSSIGNGINRYRDTKKERSWDKLLINLYKKTSGLLLKKIPKPGVSYTEFFDILLLLRKKTVSKTTIRKEFINYLEEWELNNHHKFIVDKIKNYNCPILTTNFDELLPKSVDAKVFYTVENRQKGFSDFYPWQCYYSNKKLRSNFDGFAIWFINGMIKYPRSIKLGLGDYLRNFSRANDLLPYKRKKKEVFVGKNSWLNHFFNKSLFIFGLGLEEQEIFIRWLLLQRGAYFNLNPRKRKQGWYIYNDNIDKGKEFFLKSVGIEPIKFINKKYLYEDFWKSL